MAAIVLLVYGASQMSGVAYDDADIGVVDFSTLNSSQKKAALQASNRERCTCGCGMSLAQCVVTDQTCPFRAAHIDRIRKIVEEHQ